MRTLLNALGLLKPRDPESLLKQNIRELEDRVPELNEKLAMIKAQVNLVQGELEALIVRERELAGQDDGPARGLLAEIRREIPHQRSQLAIAEQALVKALGIKRAFMLDKERKIQVAKDALSLRRAAEWNRKTVGVLTDMERRLMRIESAEPSLSELEQEAQASERQFAWALERLDEALESTDRDAVAERVACLRSFLRGEEVRAEARLAKVRGSLFRWEERLQLLEG